MKVVHIAHSLKGGAGIGLLRYHLALLAEGVDSRILVAEGENNAYVALLKRCRTSLLDKFKRRLHLSGEANLSIMKRLSSLDTIAGGKGNFEQFSPPYSDYEINNNEWVKKADIVNLHWVAWILDWERFFKNFEKSVVFTLHDQQPYLGGFHYHTDLDRNSHLWSLESEVRDIKKQALGEHRKVGVVSNSRWNTSEALTSGFFGKRATIETIHYPLDCEVYFPREKVSAKEAFGIRGDRLVLGFAADNLKVKRKGVMELLEAITLLPKRLVENLSLMSFGGRWENGMLKDIGIPHVHLGFIDSDILKVAAYSAMDIFVVPSHVEAFGLTAIEAQACGTCVLSSPVSGLLDADVTHQDSKGLKRPYTSEELSEKIAELLKESTKRDSLARDGREHVLTQHDPAMIGRKLIAFYERLLS
ncbi:MAG: glycosyltransferase [Opitutales bacterium]|nr:glycosyltransferase [Opitutales bacterium]